MGANYSKQLSEIVNKTITDQSNEILNSSEFSTTSILNNNQKMNVDLHVNGNSKCGYRFKQDTVIENTIFSTIDSEKQAELQKTIMEKLDNKLKNEVKQDISGLPIGTANVSSIKQKVENYSFHDLSNSIANYITNSVNSAVESSQDQNIKVFIDGDLLCQDDLFMVTQNIDVKQIVDNVVKDKNVTNAINNFTKEVENDVTAFTSAKIAGLDPLAFIGLMLGLFIGLPIMIIIIVVIVRALRK